MRWAVYGGIWLFFAVMAVELDNWLWLIFAALLSIVYHEEG